MIPASLNAPSSPSPFGQPDGMNPGTGWKYKKRKREKGGLLSKKFEELEESHFHDGIDIFLVCRLRIGDFEGIASFE